MTGGAGCWDDVTSWVGGLVSWWGRERGRRAGSVGCHLGFMCVLVLQTNKTQFFYATCLRPSLAAFIRFPPTDFTIE